MNKLENDIKKAKQTVTLAKKRIYLSDENGILYRFKSYEYMVDRVEFMKENPHANGNEKYSNSISKDTGLNDRCIRNIVSYARNGIKTKSTAKDDTLIYYIKELGKFHKGNELAYLEQIDVEKLVDVKNVEKEKQDYIYFFYYNLLNILYELKHIMFEKSIDITEFYQSRLNSLKKEVDNKFANDKETKIKLLSVMEEINYIVKTDSVPDVPKNWYKINEKIAYFDPVFDILKENEELFGKIKNNFGIHFSFIPSKEEIKNREKYLKEVYLKYGNDFREDSLYAQELIYTFRIVMKNYFPQMLF